MSAGPWHYKPRLRWLTENCLILFAVSLRPSRQCRWEVKNAEAYMFMLFGLLYRSFSCDNSALYLPFHGLVIVHCACCPPAQP